MADRRKGPTGKPTPNGAENISEAGNLTTEHSTALCFNPAAGEIVALSYMPGRFEVVSVERSVTLRTPSGAILRTGWRTVRRDGGQ